MKLLFFLVREMDLLKDKVALITGCRGICQALVMTFAKEGADLAFTFVRSADVAKDMAKTIHAMGRRAIAVQGDLRKIADIDKIVKTTLAEYGRIDVLVNCAGVYTYTVTEDTPEEVYDLDMDTNLKGTFFSCIKVAKAAMIPRRRGKIINISTTGGVTPGSNLAPYYASKAGVIHLTREFAMEWGKYGINVICVSPGYTATQRMLKAIEKGETNGEAIKRSIPLRRFAQPEEIAETVAWLASDKCSYISGANIIVDGGYQSGILTDQ